jgi:uncharacterized Zn finger protein
MTAKHYSCGGKLVEQQNEEYRCQKCGRVVRASVVNEHGSFKRVAESDGPLSEIATVALGGVDDV